MRRSTLRRELLLNGIVQITFLPIIVVMLTTAGLLSRRDDVFFTLALGPPVLVWTFLLFRCLAIRSRLKNRNYEWIRVPSAFQLCIALGSRVHHIPPRDQLATLPGYKDGDVESIIDLMERSDPQRPRRTQARVGTVNRKWRRRISLKAYAHPLIASLLFVAANIAEGSEYLPKSERLWADRIAIFALVLLVLWWVRCWLQTLKLRSRGYAWMGFFDAMTLYQSLGSRIRRIPPRDQLATLPGYKDGDVESIIDLMERPDRRR